MWKRHRLYSLDGTWDRVLAALLTRADVAGLINWEVSVGSTVVRAHRHGTSLPRHTGELSNHRNLLVEPPDHAVGRSRGGLSTKIHALAEGNKRPLMLLLGLGQGGDSPMSGNPMEALEVKKARPGRPRSRPDRAMADKAYSSRAIRKYLRDRGIQCVIPEKECFEGLVRGVHVFRVSPLSFVWVFGNGSFGVVSGLWRLLAG